MDSSLVDELKALKKQLSEAEIRALNREAGAVEQLQARLEIAQLERDAAIKDRDDHRMLLSSAVAGGAQLAKELEDCRVLLAKQDEEINRLRDANDTAQTARRRAEEAVQANRTLTAENEAMREELHRLEKEISALRPAKAPDAVTTNENSTRPPPTEAAAKDVEVDRRPATPSEYPASAPHSPPTSQPRLSGSLPSTLEALGALWNHIRALESSRHQKSIGGGSSASQRSASQHSASAPAPVMPPSSGANRSPSPRLSAPQQRSGGDARRDGSPASRSSVGRQPPRVVAARHAARVPLSSRERPEFNVPVVKAETFRTSRGLRPTV